MVHIHTDNSTEPTTSQPLRWAYYGRESEWADEKEGALETHRRDCDKRAEIEGGAIGLRYIDNDFSGTNADRPAFQNMMLDAQAGRFDVLIIWKWDRFMRNARLFNEYFYRLKDDYGIRIISVVDGIDTANENFAQNIVIQMLATVAEAESKSIGERIKAKWHRDLAEGRKTMALVKFGYRYDPEKRQYFIIESEAAVVRLIFQWRTEGHGTQQIVDLLNEQGCRTRGRKHKGESEPRPGLWRTSSVLNVLRGQIYKGKHRIGFDVPPIVDEPTWHTAQRKLDEARHVKRPNYNTTPLAGCVVCAEDGYRYTVHHQSRKRGGHIRMGCFGADKRAHLDGTPRCDSRRLKLSWLEEQVGVAIIRALNDPEGLKMAVEEALNDLADKTRRLGDTKAIDTELAMLEAKKDNLQLERIEGRLDKGKWLTWYKTFEKHKADLMARKSAIDPAIRKEIAELDGTIEAAQAFLDGDPEYQARYIPMKGLMADWWAVSSTYYVADTDETVELESHHIKTIREASADSYKEWLRKAITELDVKVMVSRDGSLDITGRLIPSAHVSVTNYACKPGKSHIPHSSTRIPFKASVPALVKGGAAL